MKHMKQKPYSKFRALPFYLALTSIALAGSLQAAVTFTIQDAGPSVNASSPPIFINGAGSVSSSIAAAPGPITYTVSNLDFTSIGGALTEEVVFTVSFAATGGSVEYNTSGNVHVGPSGATNQIDVGETLTTTVALTSTTFAGGIPNLSIAFSQVQNGAWGDGDSVKLTYSTGNVTLTRPTDTSNTYNFPSVTNFFTQETLAGGLNLQRYNVIVTAVPEPSSVLLGGLGLLALLRRRR